MKPTRAELDAIAWKTIDEAPVVRGRQPAGYASSGRPANYVELAQMTQEQGWLAAFSEYLHEYYRFKSASFFAEPPPDTFSREYRAMLAGVAEYLSMRFGLPVPAWTNEPEFFLTEEWDPWEDVVPDIEQYRDERRARSHEAFIRRRVICETRSLIRL